ncbi:GNAT family N-acetyltransferase [Paenibacillus humicola]|uniref:GNAT family N-acetyltransferase n=1 Tax=Paenibacillus humicola TaxID=3110540 RepID=UPI00237BF35E|nr:GNAT family N-acetyltransferase [Paenibacillus humicola]
MSSESGGQDSFPKSFGFPALETPRLRLRRLSASDAPAVFRYMSQEIVMRYYDLPVFRNLYEAERIIGHWNRRFEDGEGIRWALELKESGGMIGTCGFHNWQREHCRAELGYELSPDHWARGYMAEALQAVIRFGFGAMRLNRIEAYTEPENVASIKLLLKSGLVKEGLLREIFFEKNRFFDAVVFSLLRSEYEEGGDFPAQN